MSSLGNKIYFTASILILALAIVFWFKPDSVLRQKNEQTAQPLPLAEDNPPSTTLIAVGDMLLSRHVGAKIDQTENPNLPFENLGQLLSNADITLGNLECPLDENGPAIREGLVFRCLAKYIPGLKFAGFDILSLANNHALDQGLDNLEFTIDYLLSENILPIGTGKNFDEAHRGRVIEKDNTKFGFLAYSYTAANNSQADTNNQIATWEDPEQVRLDIENLKEKSDIVIVSIHAGTEYTRNPTPAQVDFAHLAIDAGADAVIGHHPHWVQTIEIYNEKPIFYSLGNFVFDQEWSQETKEGLVVQLTFNDLQLTEAKLTPVIIENFCCPRLADEEEKATILNKIQLESDTIVFDKKETIPQQ